MKNLFVTFLFFSIVISATAQDVKIARTALDKLYPDHGSISYSLYTDFYSFSFWDDDIADMKEVLIDINGELLATDLTEIQHTEDMVSNITDSCTWKKTLKGKNGKDEEIFIVFCFQPEDKDIIYVLNNEYGMIRKGQRK